MAFSIDRFDGSPILESQDAGQVMRLGFGNPARLAWRGKAGSQYAFHA
jgi:hypothetical protein